MGVPLNLLIRRDFLRTFQSFPKTRPGEPMEVLSAANPLILRILWLTAKWTGVARMKALKRVVSDGEEILAEVLFLRDRVAQLETELALARRQERMPGRKPRYTVKERLLVLWYPQPKSTTSPHEEHKTWRSTKVRLSLDSYRWDCLQCP